MSSKFSLVFFCFNKWTETKWITLSVKIILGQKKITELFPFSRTSPLEQQTTEWPLFLFRIYEGPEGLDFFFFIDHSFGGKNITNVCDLFTASNIFKWVFFCCYKIAHCAMKVANVPLISLQSSHLYIFTKPAYD